MTKVKRPHAGDSRKMRAHTMRSDEITEWFQVWGIVGKSRQRRDVLIRLHPQLDRGPGFGR